MDGFEIEASTCSSRLAWENAHKFSSLIFVIRVNLLHSQPSLLLYALLFLGVFYLGKLLFSFSHQFKGNSIGVAKITQYYSLIRMH